MRLPYYITWSKQHSAETLPVAKAHGCYFTTPDGREVLDFTSTSFQSCFGHSNELIKQKIKEQLDLMPIASPKATFDLKDRATRALIKYLRLEGGQIFYTVSGAESIENALKIARQIKQRKIILARKVSYHGASLGALSITGDWRNEAHATVDEWTVRIPEPTDDPTLKQTRAIIESTGPKTIAGICLESITGSNGVIIPDKEWWKRIQALCKEFDLFLIVDEALCGFKRTGKPFAFQHFDVQPDMVVMAKNITAGYIPFGAIWTNPEISKFYQNETFSCGLTNSAHPLGLAAMEAVLQQLQDPQVKDNIHTLEIEFSKQLAALENTPFVSQVRHKGLLAAVELKKPVATWSAFFENGLHVICKPKMLTLAPAYTMTIEELRLGFTIIRKTLEASEKV